MKNQFTSTLQASSLESQKYLKKSQEKSEHYLKNNDIIQRIKYRTFVVQEKCI